MEKKTMHMIGNAHLDPVWLWRWQEGFAEVKATFRSALDRMNEFPEFIFTCACAAYYQWVEENEPEMFEEIRERVKEGRWVIAGGWWIQPDCNMPSGESFARHGLYSQRYFKEKFGVTARFGYNVDSFGHVGTLPQILKLSGMDSYVFMRPLDSENSRIPNLFKWQSADGSEVLAYKIPELYNTQGDSMDMERYEKAQKLGDEQGIEMMEFYGVGNHGGGPTISNLNYIREHGEEPEDFSMVCSDPNRYFDKMRAENREVPTWNEDLQHCASGCYSTKSELKKNNRIAEHRLQNAEKFAAVAYAKLGFDPATERLGKAWENVMFNHFHDVLCGCSIESAFDDAREMHGEALSVGAKVLNAAVQKISWNVDTMAGLERVRSKEKDWNLWETGDMGAPLLVFNPLPWEANVPVQINKYVHGITDSDGNPVEAQKVRGQQTNGADKWNSVFVGKIPAMGYRLYWIYSTKDIPAKASENMLEATDTSLENEYLKVEFDAHNGYIKSIFDKKAGREVLSGAGAVPAVIDVDHCDTWAHWVFKFHDEVAKFADAKVRLIENGPLRATVRVTNSYNTSVLTQDFILYRDKADIEVRVRLDWREKKKLLKLCFPAAVSEPKATYEQPYGFIEKAPTGEEEVGHQWFDVSGNTENGVYGLSVLNDCKYSFEVRENEMRMTVANGSIYADHCGGEYLDEFCEYLDQGVQKFTYVIAPHSGTWQSAGIVRRAHELNTAPITVFETYHKGGLPPMESGVSVAADNVAAMVFKRAEDKNGYILRCYEMNGKQTETAIELPVINRKWNAAFRPCEIKTFFIPDNENEDVRETNLLEF